MRSLRLFVAGLLGCGAGYGTLYLFQTGGFGSLENGLFSSMIVYPAALLAAAIVFWVIFAAMDPGSER